MRLYSLIGASPTASTNQHIHCCLGRAFPVLPIGGALIAISSRRVDEHHIGYGLKPGGDAVAHKQLPVILEGVDVDLDVITWVHDEPGQLWR